jgi:hypothetical protein
MKMEQTQCSETSAIKHLTPENNPKDSTRKIYNTLLFYVVVFNYFCKIHLNVILPVLRSPQFIYSLPIFRYFVCASYLFRSHCRHLWPSDCFVVRATNYISLLCNNFHPPVTSPQHTVLRLPQGQNGFSGYSNNALRIGPAHLLYWTAWRIKNIFVLLIYSQRNSTRRWQSLAETCRGKFGLYNTNLQRPWALVGHLTPTTLQGLHRVTSTSFDSYESCSG